MTAADQHQDEAMYEDPAFRRSVHTLFDTVWKHLTPRIALAARAGADWHAVSAPFVEMEGSTAVAHVGVIEIPLVLDGTPTTVAGVHAVGTHPEHRKKGHITRLLGRALAHVEERGLATAQLTTASPRVFTPSGFRDLPMTRFEVAPVARSETTLRQLSIHSDADRELLWRLLRHRTPVSHRLGVVEPGWLFVIDEVLASSGFSRLYAADDLDTVVALSLTGDTLTVLDVVARELPPIEELLARVPFDFRRVLLSFCPDRFDTQVIATHPGDADEHLMVRGPYTAGPLYLPPLAHC